MNYYKEKIVYITDLFSRSSYISLITIISRSLQKSIARNDLSAIRVCPTLKNKQGCSDYYILVLSANFPILNTQSLSHLFHSDFRFSQSHVVLLAIKLDGLDHVVGSQHCNDFWVITGMDF